MVPLHEPPAGGPNTLRDPTGSWRGQEPGFAADKAAQHGAEPATTLGLRPDEASVRSQGAYIQCFPTKLTLAPDLGDKVLAVLPAPSGSTQPTFDAAQPVPLGAMPW